MKKILLMCSLALFVIASCKKGEGLGGTSKITGKIWVQDFNTLNNPGDMYHLKGEYPGADEDVFIIYGSDISYGNKVKSGPDGSFEFPYLRGGNYRIYVQSRDTTRASVSGLKTVDIKVFLGSHKKTVDTGILTIYK